MPKLTHDIASFKAAFTKSIFYELNYFVDNLHQRIPRGSFGVSLFSRIAHVALFFRIWSGDWDLTMAISIR